jgi:hypothetical protein
MSRIPLIATTGTTLASWQDKRELAAHSVQAGEFDLNINGGGNLTDISLGTLPQLALNNGATAGAPQSTSAVLNYKVTGKNNRMRLDLTGVTTGSTDLTDNLEVAASSVSPSTAACPAIATGYKPLSGYTSTNLANLANSQGSLKLCLSVRVKGGATAAVGGKTGTLTLSLLGTQVRP